ncbi:hypothetical protein [Microbacterium paraoxydans]|uniref:Uncharacterized protein n=1 Tax=Microbacterium paraoxydans TaxID=199592 RepID=A0ABS5IK56_9MICO|nr:hypothetical protein [Microbacterium paraoxydans]MBS0023325.1 hypothetical protein [Microbacterium paraoxydans]
MPAGTDASPSDAETWSRELRDLERRAYGRCGGLTSAEAQRLRELQDARRSAAAEPGSPTSASRHDNSVDADPDSAADSDSTARPTDATASEPRGGDGHRSPDPHPASASDAATVRSVLRRHLVGSIAAVVALVAIGVTAGWALFAPRDATLPLTAAQEERRAELIAGDYDPGSVRAVAQSDDALAWYATQDEGERRCLVLDVGESSQSACRPAGEIAEGLNVMVPLSFDAPDEDGRGIEQVVATLLLSTEGEPMVSIDRWNMSTSMLSQFDEPQRDRAKELLADGYDLGLTIVGLFREQPVWIGERQSATDVLLTCLIVDADDSRQCLPRTEALESGLGMQVVDVDQQSGDVVAVSAVDVRFTSWQIPYLSVTTGAVLTEPPAGDSYLVTTGPPGDPIRVEIPDRDPDG